MCVVANIWVVMVRMEHWFLAAPSPKAEAQGKGCIRTGVQFHQGKYERGIQSPETKGRLRSRQTAAVLGRWSESWVKRE